MTTIRKKSWVTISNRLSRPVKGCHLCDCSARRRKPQQPNRQPSKENHPVSAPDAAERSRRIAKGLYRPACDLDLHEPAVGEEADEAAVGRPEGHQRVLRAGERPGFTRIESAHPQLDQAAGGRREGQMTAIRRDSDMPKARLLRRQDGSYEDTHV